MNSRKSNIYNSHFLFHRLTSCHSKTQSFNSLLFKWLRFMNSAHSGINTSNLDSRKAYISFNQFKMTIEFDSVKVLALNFIFHNFSAPIVVWRPLKIFAEWDHGPPPPPCQHATGSISHVNARFFLTRLLG